MRKPMLLIPLLAAFAGSASAQVPAGAENFRAIELRGGGIVTVRHGPTRQVSVIGDNPGRIIRAEHGRLIIDRCARGCARNHRFKVEIVTPELDTVAVSDGGLIEVGEGFARQRTLTAAVSQGGVIDMRALEADDVTAAVQQGGRILVHPTRELTGAVSHGGVITYWGDPQVVSSVSDGGVVHGGDAGDLRRPLSEIDAGLMPPPPVPPVPPQIPAKR